MCSCDGDRPRDLPHATAVEQIVFTIYGLVASLYGNEQSSPLTLTCCLPSTVTAAAAAAAAGLGWKWAAVLLPLSFLFFHISSNSWLKEGHSNRQLDYISKNVGISNERSKKTKRMTSGFLSYILRAFKISFQQFQFHIPHQLFTWRETNESSRGRGRQKKKWETGNRISWRIVVQMNRDGDCVRDEESSGAGSRQIHTHIHTHKVADDTGKERGWVRGLPVDRYLIPPFLFISGKPVPSRPPHPSGPIGRIQSGSDGCKMKEKSRLVEREKKRKKKKKKKNKRRRERERKQMTKQRR